MSRQRVRYRHSKQKAIDVRRAIIGSDFPVDVKKATDHLGYEIKYMSFNDPSVSGVIAHDRDRVVIAVNENHHERRQRFTIAHELGHALLHPKEMIVDRVVLYRNAESSKGSQVLEKEANAFAAELLMPEEDIRQQIEGFDELGEDVIVPLAMRYDVSVIAMTIRLTSLRLLM